MVDFPAPFSPTKPIIEPYGREKVTFSNAKFDLENVLETCCNSKIFSIKLKILLLILVSIVAISGVVLAFIIPNAKSAVTTATENNMQDIVSLSSKLVDDQINLNGIDSVDATVLGTIFDGVGIEGVDSSYVYVVDENKMFIYHPKEEKIGTEVFNTTVSDLVDSIPSGNYEKEKIFHYTDENGVVKYAAYCVSDLSGWTTVIVGNEDDALATINSLQSGSILIISRTTS